MLLTFGQTEVPTDPGGRVARFVGKFTQSDPLAKLMGSPLMYGWG